MKKTALILMSVVVLLAFALTACGQAAATTAAAPAETTAAPAETTAAPAETTAAAAEGVRLGFGSHVSAAKSANAEGDALTVAQSYVSYASVLIDADSRIVKVWIDATVNEIEIDDKGAIVTDVTGLGSTKRELGDAYGMKKASPIGKEWFEQADALEAFLIGKTIAEIEAAPVEGDKKVFTDLKTSSTFGPTNYITALKKAVAAAEKATPTAATKLGFGSVVTMNKSAAATAEKAGVAQSYHSLAVAAVDDSGKVLDVWVDAIVHDVNFDTKGLITSDTKVLGSTKRELGDEYGMKKASPIGKEWWEQADALETFLEGKTMADIEAAPVEGDKKVFTDLKTSSTFGPGHYVESLKKAVEQAR